MSAGIVIKRSWTLGFGAAGILGLIALGVGLALHPQRAMISYIFALAFWWTLAMGALLALLIFHATGARWIAPFRRFNELLALPVILTSVAIIPVLAMLKVAYPWARPDWVERSPEVVRTLRAVYLNPTFFVLRGVLFVACFSAVAVLMLRLSLRQDREPGEALQGRMRVLAASALPVMLFAATFACFDWLMSLTPDWWSELYGVYVLSGGVLGALALLILISQYAFNLGLLPTASRSWHFHSLGKLLFALVCFWAYIAYDQYMLVWIADKPLESSWYIARSQLGWRPMFIALLIAQFVVPFLVLLGRPAKTHFKTLGAVCIWLLAAHLFDVYWLVIPSSGERIPRWTDLAAFIGLGGVYVAFTLWRFSVTPQIAVGAPALRPERLRASV